MEPEKLKEVILRAQVIREDSWIIRIKDSSGECMEGYYTKDHSESAKEAILESNENEKWIQVIYLINYHAWNDIQHWQV